MVKNISGKVCLNEVFLFLGQTSLEEPKVGGKDASKKSAIKESGKVAPKKSAIKESGMDGPKTSAIKESGKDYQDEEEGEGDYQLFKSRLSTKHKRIWERL